MKDTLLPRDEFRHAVFKRDGYKCIICGEPAILDDKNEPTNLDAHHIIERRLFTSEDIFGGYLLDNGASLCSIHHIKAEETTLSCDEIRERAGIKTIIIPEHFYSDCSYDKWGNIILSSGQRIRGELFYDESVQKILKQGGVLDLFQKYIKYQRTYHLPWSNLLKDDRMMRDDSFFIGKRVVTSLKMDGENSSLYNDYIHARSLDSITHETRKWLKGLWSRISYMIDDNMRICGENLYAVHSIKYNNLPSYFMVFSIWIDNKCLSWDETLEYCKIIGLETVPVIYDGVYNRDEIIKAFEPYKETNEGYIIRIADEFNYIDFRKSVGKFVRPEFRQVVNNSHGHWISKKVEVNELSK